MLYMVAQHGGPTCSTWWFCQAFWWMDVYMHVSRCSSWFMASSSDFSSIRQHGHQHCCWNALQMALVDMLNIFNSFCSGFKDRDLHAAPPDVFMALLLMWTRSTVQGRCSPVVVFLFGGGVGPFLSSSWWPSTWWSVYMDSSTWFWFFNMVLVVYMVSTWVPLHVISSDLQQRTAGAVMEFFSWCNSGVLNMAKKMCALHGQQEQMVRRCGTMSFGLFFVLLF
jgi:hypothetical protein